MDLYPKYEKCKVSLTWALISNFPSLLVAVPITLLRLTILTFSKGRFVLEFKNRASRSVSYAVNNGNANSTWMSRNMIYSGGFILIFLVIHFIDFWIPELNVK